MSREGAQSMGPLPIVEAGPGAAPITAPPTRITHAI